jgi:hypothetical protein
MAAESDTVSVDNLRLSYNMTQIYIYAKKESVVDNILGQCTICCPLKRQTARGQHLLCCIITMPNMFTPGPFPFRHDSSHWPGTVSAERCHHAQ